jgi:AAA+ ATPase superfamily predicted ATPase
MKKLIGRETEQTILETALVSDESEMIAITGRRRVGKTFLIRSVYDTKIDLEFTGVQDASRREQFPLCLVLHSKILQ